MSFKEYVNKSAFEDWIYENICCDGNFKIDWEKEREWISDTAFTRHAVSNTGKKTFKPLSEYQRHFDSMLLEYGGGQITITVDKKCQDVSGYNKSYRQLFVNKSTRHTPESLRLLINRLNKIK